MKNRRGRGDVARKETEEDIITRIAWLYYKEKMTQQEIAERIFLSRQKVQRLLEKARDLEIIQFTLRHPYMNLMSIESEIREKFGLKGAVVAPMASEAGGGFQIRALDQGRAGHCLPRRRPSHLNRRGVQVREPFQDGISQLGGPPAPDRQGGRGGHLVPLLRRQW